MIVLILVLVLHEPSSGPALTKSCATPAIALNSSTTGTGRGLQYSITGPRDGTYVVAIDATSVTIHGVTASATPSYAFAVSIHAGLPSCAAHGTLPALSEGPHQVELFRNGTVAAKAALH